MRILIILAALRLVYDFSCHLSATRVLSQTKTLSYLALSLSSTSRFGFQDCRRHKHPFVRSKCRSRALNGSVAVSLSGIEAIKSFFKERIEQMHPKVAELSAAFLMGELSYGQVGKSFKSLGLAHLFSVSGLHVNFAFFMSWVGSLLLVNISRVCIYHPHWWQATQMWTVSPFGALSFVALYVILCDGRPPGIRALIFLSMSLQSVKGDIRKPLFLTFIMQLILMPNAVLSLSFSLSWTVFLTLCCLSRTSILSKRPLLKYFGLQIAIFTQVSYWIEGQSISSIATNLLFLPMCFGLFLLVVINFLMIGFSPIMESLLVPLLFFIEDLEKFVGTLKSPLFLNAFGVFRPVEAYKTVLFFWVFLNCLSVLAKNNLDSKQQRKAVS